MGCSSSKAGQPRFWVSSLLLSRHAVQHQLGSRHLSILCWVCAAPQLSVRAWWRVPSFPAARPSQADPRIVYQPPQHQHQGQQRSVASAAAGPPPRVKLVLLGDSVRVVTAAHRDDAGGKGGGAAAGMQQHPPLACQHTVSSPATVTRPCVPMPALPCLMSCPCLGCPASCWHAGRGQVLPGAAVCAQHL